MNIKILIPIYKAQPDDQEKDSLNQLFKTIPYPIVFVTHRDLDIANYTGISSKYNQQTTYEYFDKLYFSSVTSYSRLLLSRDFYKRFETCDYIFIYQLDGFVFRDELRCWCNEGYDYIGAPWFKNYGSNENGDKLWKVGNGGVSLRRVSSFLKIFDQTMPLSIYPFYVKNIRKKRFLDMSLNTLKMLFHLLLERKTVEYYLQNFTDERINEDCFWAEGLSRTKLALHVPDSLTAARFCIEKSPSYLYRLIGNKLPFSCHAYEKYEYHTFWKKFITNV